MDELAFTLDMNYIIFTRKFKEIEWTDGRSLLIWLEIIFNWIYSSSSTNRNSCQPGLDKQIEGLYRDQEFAQR